MVFVSLSLLLQCVDGWDLPRTSLDLRMLHLSLELYACILEGASKNRFQRHWKGTKYSVEPQDHLQAEYLSHLTYPELRATKRRAISSL